MSPSRTRDAVQPTRDAVQPTRDAVQPTRDAVQRRWARAHPDRIQGIATHGLPSHGVFRASLDAVVVMDTEGFVRGWNPAAAQLFGYEPEVAVGRELAELIIPGPLREAHRHGLRRHLETGERAILGRRVELTALNAAGEEVPVEVSITPVPDSRPPVFAGFIRDLRHRNAAQQANARLQARMTFLAQAGLVLDRSLDLGETLSALAELTVPELAQLTVIDLVDERMVRSTVAAAVDPQHARHVEEMRRTHPLDLSSSHPVCEVLRSAQPMLLPCMEEPFLRKIAQGEEHLRLMHELGYRSAIVVPLCARRHVLGTLSLLRMHGSELYGEEDLVLGEELSRRAAMAVDNARLFQSTVHLARTLQDSLLPRALPEIPGVELAGRYRAAAAGQEVGGDFYDAFTIGEGCWGIAIGDVCGKGPEAAALTALARHTIRAAAAAPPEEVLAGLNAAVLRDQDQLPPRYLTALFARLLEADGRLTVELAAAGHPPPLLMRAGGSVTSIPAAGTMIGVTSEPVFQSAVVELEPGDALILYTDGLTDARAPERVLTEEDLADLLRGRPLGDPQEIASHLEQSATAGHIPRDDIALLVLRRLAAPTARAGAAAPQRHPASAGR